MTEELQCYICDDETSTGILLLNQYICRNCEEELVNTPVEQLKYEIFRRKIKDIWRQFLQEA
ncbi:hypothetical protein CACET_c00680 [Clostridium aceticum]|uniref:Uncharacterized protein n=1 Tax=Clostridium aceticum TaxID=84022 RepID=A0A0D8IAW2_9CLOT|nr:sigma factor G inhibitor Gin [Clostridium aceticum]AKL93586.1 hypothetical protein CACET_c00680 [Clostridium aceticum]KJF27177.1 hypothetical protein TZ02_08875 [Clostridium aceticum]